MARPFGSEPVIEERIAEATLRGYHVGFDQQCFRLRALVDIIRKVIPEFALGYYAEHAFPLTQIVEKVQEAAEIIYTTDKYETRGEFGELILHLLLRDFCNTVPLVSKIYFKDAYNVTVHGFDGVHATTNGSKKLWLGESKLYNDGEAAVSDLARDVVNHVNNEYIKKEFALIKRKLPENTPDIEYWRELMSKHKRLDEIYDAIVIPMVATYTSRIFVDHNDNTKSYFQDLVAECRSLHGRFQTSIEKSDVEIILFLLPVEDKNSLNAELDNRLKAMQSI